MSTHCAPATAMATPPGSLRLPALLVALWSNTMRTALLHWSARAQRRRDEAAFDRLDERALRDIGADRLLTERYVRCERDEMQWRIDSQFRG
jgi:hypothetical protein